MNEYLQFRNYFRLSDGTINPEMNETYIRMMAGYKNDKEYQLFLKSNLGKEVKRYMDAIYETPTAFETEMFSLTIKTHGHKTKKKQTFWFDDYEDLEYCNFMWLSDSEKFKNMYDKIPGIKDLEKDVKELYTYAAYLGLEKSVKFQPNVHKIRAAVCISDYGMVPFYCSIKTITIEESILIDKVSAEMKAKNEKALAEKDAEKEKALAEKDAEIQRLKELLAQHQI